MGAAVGQLSREAKVQVMRAKDVVCVTLSSCSQIDGELEHLLPSRDPVMHGRSKVETR